MFDILWGIVIAVIVLAVLSMNVYLAIAGIVMAIVMAILS